MMNASELSLSDLIGLGFLTTPANPLYLIAVGIMVWVAYRDMNMRSTWPIATTWPVKTKRRVIASVLILVTLAVLTPTAWAAMMSDPCKSGGGDWGWLGWLAGCW